MVYAGLVDAKLNYGIIAWALAFAKIISSTQVSDHVPRCLQQTAKIQKMIIWAIFRKPLGPGKGPRSSSRHESTRIIIKQ